MTPILVPFQPCHIDNYRPGVVERLSFNRERAKAACGAWENAVSVVHKGEVIGMSAAFIRGKMATVSMFLSDEIRRHPIFLHRTVRRGMQMLKECGVETIVVTCDARLRSAVGWLDRLGFKKTGKTVEHNGIDYMRYECQARNF